MTEPDWLARVQFALLPLLLVSMLAIGTGFRWFFVLWGALLIAGWLPLAALLGAAGRPRLAAVVAVAGNFWSVPMFFLAGMRGEPIGQVTPRLVSDLAEYLLIGGTGGAVAGVLFTARHWRVGRRTLVIAGVGASALAGVSCYPAMAIAWTVLGHLVQPP